MRHQIAFYGSTPAYKPVLDAEGRGDLQPELNRLSKQGNWAEMGALIDEKLHAAELEFASGLARARQPSSVLPDQT